MARLPLILFTDFLNQSTRGGGRGKGSVDIANGRVQFAISRFDDVSFLPILEHLTLGRSRPGTIPNYTSSTSIINLLGRLNMTSCRRRRNRIYPARSRRGQPIGISCLTWTLLLQRSRWRGHNLTWTFSSSRNSGCFFNFLLPVI